MKITIKDQQIFQYTVIRASIKCRVLEVANGNLQIHFQVLERGWSLKMTEEIEKNNNFFDLMLQRSS